MADERQSLAIETVEQLRAAVERYRASLRSKNGVVVFSPSGPADMGVIDALVAAVAAQDARIAALEGRLAAVAKAV